MYKLNDKRVLFLSIMVITSIIIIIKIFPVPSVERNIKMAIVKNNSSVTNLLMRRNVKYRRTRFVENINFLEGHRLVHDTHGDMGCNTDFFLDFTMKCEIKISGIYYFYIYSDDGFKLVVNSKNIGEYLTDRKFARTECKIKLSKGTTYIQLHYFQGYGALGLKGYYRFKGDGNMYLIGDSSQYIKFIEY